MNISEQANKIVDLYIEFGIVVYIEDYMTILEILKLDEMYKIKKMLLIGDMLTQDEYLKKEEMMQIGKILKIGNNEILKIPINDISDTSKNKNELENKKHELLRRQEISDNIPILEERNAYKQREMYEILELNEKIKHDTYGVTIERRKKRMKISEIINLVLTEYFRTFLSAIILICLFVILLFIYIKIF